MKKKYAYIILPAFTFLLFSYAKAQVYYALEKIKVKDDIYLLKSVNKTGFWVSGNIIVIINADDVFVVDSGLLPSVGDSAIAQIKRLTSKPVKYLLNTHWHGDHWHGNESFAKAYPGIEIISTEETYKNILRFGLLWANKKYAAIYSEEIAARQKEFETGLRRSGEKLPDNLKPFLQRTLPDNRKELEEIKNLHPVVPTLTYNKQLSIKRGTREIQLLYLGWGNTTGDGVVYLPNEKILISGDLIVYPSPYESDNFSKEWVDVLKKLRDMDFDYLLPGHGPVLTDKKYLNFLITFFEEIIKEVNQAVTEDKTLDETKVLVTHERVMKEISKNEIMIEFTKKIDPSFVEQAILRAYAKAKENKL